MKKILVFITLAILIILVASSVAAEYRRSSAQFTNPGLGTGIFAQQRTGVPRDICKSGQDFLVQIAPFGCEPAVLRTDLLEDQDSIVLCQLMATKINPLIDVDAINSIGFKGKWPEGVSAVDYHPALGAIGIDGDLSNPITNNIGYVVIKFNQQKNASKMPDYIEGELVAELRYDISNAFGVGDNTFYLPEMSDSDWEKEKDTYSFWKGRGYLRADEVTPTSATISIHDDLRKIVGVNLKKGEASYDILVPGYECLAALQLRLKGLVNPDTRARFNVNGDIIELIKGETFLDGGCTVNEVERYGVISKSKIRCGSESFWLTLSPRVKLDINGVDNYDVGDFLGFASEGAETKYLYLAYAGTLSHSIEEEDLEILVVALPEHKGEKLTENDIKAVSGIVKLKEDAREGKANLWEVTKAVVGVYTGGVKKIVDALRGKDYTWVKYGESETYKDKSIGLLGFSEPLDSELDKDTQDYYERALDDYDRILSSFTGTYYPPENKGVVSKGEQAYVAKIELANKLNQKRVVVDFCREFDEAFPESNLKADVQEYCSDKARLSNSGIVTKNLIVDGESRYITLEGVYEPSFQEFGATIAITDDKRQTEYVNLRRNQKYYLEESSDAFIQLLDLEPDSAEVRVVLPKRFLKEVKDIVYKDSETLRKDIPATFGSDYSFTLTHVNLQKLALVSLNSKVNYQKSEANFSFKIGVEKRGISLAPDEIKKKIEALDKSIAKWEDAASKLGKLVKGMKAACFGVSAYLTIKNFWENTQGKSLARQNVMRGEGGWYDICERKVTEDRDRYQSIERCLSMFSDEIERDVNAYYKDLREQDERIKKLQEKLEETGFFGSKSVNTSKLKEEYLKLYGEDIKKSLEERYKPDESGMAMIGDEEINLTAVLAGLGSDKVSFEEIRELELHAGMSGSDDLNDLVSERLNARVDSIYNKVHNVARVESVADGLKKAGHKNVNVIVVGDESKKHYYTGMTALESYKQKYGIEKGVPIQVISYDKTYLLELFKADENNYDIKNIYDYDTGVKLDENNEADKAKIDEINKQITYLEYVDESSYKNEYLSSLGEDHVVLRFFETEPYAGMPAIVPFDKKEGWYVSVRQVLPVMGEIRSYDESGRPNSFYLCNVGPNNKEENRGGEDDICYSFVNNVKFDEIHALGRAKTGELVEAALKAIQQAKSQFGNKEIVIDTSRGRWRIRVGEPAVEVPDIQCQDFMSPSDCKLMFNACDPVICPSSRCNLGGKYYVKDVIQSGIIGSVALCAPNFVGFGGDVYIPVCLSGINAGLEGWISGMKGYRSCLQHSLETGETVGVCDQFYSIYTCEFFWRHGIGFAKYAIPKLIEYLSGQGTRGGGEYLAVQDAWSNAEKSVNYFTQYYAKNAFEAFKYRSTEEVGGEVCKVFASGVYPASGDVFDALTEPDSPTQFFAKFDEMPFTTVTNPPISHYKVFYHIYAGNDRPVYYKVYLSGAPESSFYQDTRTLFIASGYIAPGKEATASPDFTAPSGYKEICVMANDQLECGFKQVSTNFALEYIRDKYVADQASRTDIKSYKECVGGSMSLYGMLNPNVQEGLDETLTPEIYNRGLVRVCATENPGKHSDEYYNTQNQRWVEVGYCDDENMKCWLDKASVDDAIEITTLKEGVLDYQTQRALELLAEGGDYLSREEFRKLVEEINEIENPGERLKLIEDYSGKIFWDNHKGHILLLRGNAYGELAIKIFDREYVFELGDVAIQKTLFLAKDKDELRFEINDKLYTLKFVEIVDGKAKFVVDSKEFVLGDGEDEIWEVDGVDKPVFYIGVVAVLEKLQRVDVELRAADLAAAYLEYKVRTVSEVEVIMDRAIIGNIISSSCKQYVDKIVEAAGKYKIPDPLLLLALMQQESSCNKDASSEDYISFEKGASYGLMQISGRTWCGKYGLPSGKSACKETLLKDTTKNILVGAQILRDYHPVYKSKKWECSAFESKNQNEPAVDELYSGWEYALRSYQGWECARERSDGSEIYSDHDYVEKVMRIYNQLASYA